jgi:hypothetical protein
MILKTLTPIPEFIKQNFDSWIQYKMENFSPYAKKAEDYYYSDVEGTHTNYTQKQTQRIEDVTRISATTNFIYPITNQKLALLTQPRPSIKFVSIDSRYENEIMILDKMKYGVFTVSKFEDQDEEATKHRLITGLSGTYIEEDKVMTNNPFGVKIRFIHHDEFTLDPNAREKDGSDGQGQFVHRSLTKIRALELFGHIIQEISTEDGQEVGVEAFTGTFVTNQIEVEGESRVALELNWTADTETVYSRYYFERIWTTMYLIQGPDGSVKRVFAEELTENEMPLLRSAFKKETAVFVRRYTCLGDYVVEIKMLPIKGYPVKTAYNEWAGKSYKCYGMVHFLIGLQEGTDKLIQIMILNGMLLNNVGYTAPKGSITPADKKKWELSGASPGIIKEYTPKPYGDGSIVLKPEREQVGSLGNFYPMMLEMFRQAMEYTSGITPVLTGNTSQTQLEVFSTVQAFQNAAMQRVMMALKSTQSMHRDLGQTLAEYMIANITPGTYRFFDDEGRMNEVKIASDLVKTIGLADIQVAVIPYQVHPTQKISFAAEISKIAQSTADPTMRDYYTIKAAKLAGLPEAKEIEEEMGTIKNLQGRIQQLAEELKRRKEINKQNENKMINALIENRVFRELLRFENMLGQAEQKVKDMMKQMNDREKENIEQ